MVRISVSRSPHSKEVFTQRRQDTVWNREFLRVYSVELRDALQLPDRLAERNEDLGITVVVIQVHDRFRKARDQLTQDLTLHRREVEKPVDDQELHFRKPWHLHAVSVNQPAQHPDCPKLIGVFFGKQVLVKQIGVGGINERDLVVEIDLRYASRSG